MFSAALPFLRQHVRSAASCGFTAAAAAAGKGSRWSRRLSTSAAPQFPSGFGGEEDSMVRDAVKSLCAEYPGTSFCSLSCPLQPYPCDFVAGLQATSCWREQQRARCATKGEERFFSFHESHHTVLCHIYIYLGDIIAFFDCALLSCYCNICSAVRRSADAYRT